LAGFLNGLLGSQIESTSDALQRASGTEELCGWRRERC